MNLKSLAGNGFGIVAVAATASLAVGAAPASADITALHSHCVTGGVDGCTNAFIGVTLTDSTPVSFTLNGVALAGGPFTPKVSSTGEHYVAITLDCTDKPFHIVAAQKSATGAVISQMEGDYSPPGPSTSLTGGSSLLDSGSGPLNSGSNILFPCHVVSQN
ncbi:hypothetical protein [Nocardia tengchongensis]|uniref:hypothetical protein n=1 Tax=Nocardia tengchongensis TaxID=2055889 RepID=UPI0036BD3829